MAESKCKQSHLISDFSRITEKYLSCLNVRKDGFVSGYIDCSKMFKDFVESLRDCGITFCVRTSVGTDNKHYFSLRTNHFCINFDGCPFTVKRTTHYQCVFGAKYFPSRKRSSKLIDVKSLNKRQYSSKKNNCPAKMVVKHLKFFPDYKAESKEWRKKQELLQKLRADFPNSSPVDRFMVLISSADSHNHPPQNTKVLSPDLVNLICDYNAKGFCSVTDAKKVLYEYVHKLFENSERKPPLTDETYYPTYQTVYNYMSKFRRKASDLCNEEQADDSSNVCVPNAFSEHSDAELTHNIPAERAMLQNIQETADQVFLLYSENTEKVDNNFESSCVSVLVINDNVSGGNTTWNQEVTGETISLSNFAGVETNDVVVASGSCNVNCNLQNLSQQCDETLPLLESSEQTTQLGEFYTLVDCAQHENNGQGVDCADKDVEARQTFLELLDNIRATVPTLTSQQIEMGINILKECQNLFLKKQCLP